MHDMPTIPIQIEIETQAEGICSPRLSALLYELLQNMQALLEKEVVSEIDLMTLPLSQQEKQQLEDILGEGEVNISLNTLGLSTIKETGFAGVWWVKHFNEESVLMAEHIQVAYEPPLIAVLANEVKNDTALFEEKLSQLQLPERS